MWQTGCRARWASPDEMEGGGGFFLQFTHFNATSQMSPQLSGC